MHILYDLWHTNVEVFKRTNKLMAEHDILMYVGLIYIPFLFAANYVASLLPLFGGMLWFFSIAVVLSDYFYLIDLATKGYKTGWSDVKDGVFVFSRKVFNILFILWVVDFGVKLLVLPLLPGFLAVIVLVVYWGGTFLLLNALPEVLYQKQHSDIEAIKYAWQFQKRNLVTWYVPNVLMIGLMLSLGLLFGPATRLFSNLPTALASAAITVVMLIVAQFLMGYFMLYRGLLFNKLDTTSRQRRTMKITH